MFSTDNIPKEVKELVDKLLKDIISTSEISSENFQRCSKFMLYHIWCEVYPSPNENQTKELLEGFATRYDYIGFPDYAHKLAQCVAEYTPPTPKDEIDNNKVKWRVLEFLLKMSFEAFKTQNIFSLENKLKESRKAVYPEEITEEECINWFQYLREGSEKFDFPSDQESDEETTLQNISVQVDLQSDNVTPLYNDVFENLDQRESLVLDENATILSAFAHAMQSKNWLFKNKQNSWWDERYCSSVKSKHFSADFGIKWEKAQNTLVHSSPSVNNMVYEYYTEYKIIKEILWILLLHDKSRVSRRIEFLRSQVSVTSLIQETFSSFIHEMLETAEKYHVLLEFNEQIFSENILTMPFALQAYALTLKTICQPFVKKVLDLEKDFPENSSTLLRVQEELRPYFEQINFIYDVHLNSIHPRWSTEPAWFVIVRLLSIVHSKLQELLEKSRIEILLKIFFNTFKVYANFIDHWLTEGKLNDWKNEFFMKRLDDGTCVIFPTENAFVETFAFPFFFKIGERLQNCSKNVDFLCKLDRMPQLKAELLKKGKLIDVFLKEFLRRVFKESSTSITDLKLHDRCENMSTVLDHNFLNADSFNVYLVQAFSDQLYANNDTEILQTKIDTLQDLDDLPDLELFKVNDIIEDSLCYVIGIRENIIATLFKSSLVNEYRLFEHFRNLSDLLVMDLHGFCNKINIRLNKQIWEGDHLIKVFLYDCVESNKLIFGDLYHFTVDKEENSCEIDICVSKIIKVIDRIHLKYAVQWPMNMIFNDEIIKNFYEKLLILVLKVNTAFSSVTRLYFKDLPQVKLMVFEMRRMQMLRYWVVQLLSKLRSYLNLIICQHLNWKLIEKNIEINTFSSLQNQYTCYLESIKQECLISSEMQSWLENALLRIWDVCDNVRDLWMKSIKLQLTGQDINRSVELYLQCLWYLTQVLEKFVKENHKNNPLFDLWSDFSYMMKGHKKNIPEDLSFQYSMDH